MVDADPNDSPQTGVGERRSILGTSNEPVDAVVGMDCEGLEMGDS